MRKVPSLPYFKIIHALQRAGWTVVSQRGSHIKIQKHIGNKLLRVIIPAHRPVKRSTLAKILKQAHIGIDEFLELL